MYAYWHYISIIAHLLTLWHLSNDRLHLPTRENYCTFSLICAGISSINGASSCYRTSREGDFWVFGVQILTPEIISLGSRGHRFRVRKSPIPILMNVWLLGCKRMHPGLQTLASGMISLNNHTLNLWYSTTKKPPFCAFLFVYLGDYVCEVILKRILGRFCPLLASYECGWKQTRPNMMDSESSSVIQKVSQEATWRA